MPSWSKSPFYSSKDVRSKETYAKDVFFSALSSPKAKEETASLSFGSSFGFPRIVVAGARPAFFSPIKHKAAFSWQCFRWQETLGLVGASEHNESKPKTNQGSLPSKPIGEGLKDGTYKVVRAPVV
ncbi:60S ribosomal protein L2, mitochondrial [Capsicum chinense]|nr:60S ribosomal protein L2, mitochondrial [Capsicum chinense]